MKTYTTPITKLEPNQIFVFGANTQGRHGKGSAFWAYKHAGAIRGKGYGTQGQSFGIVTKDLHKMVHPSIESWKIISQINDLYIYARKHPELQFMVAYSTAPNLNGYTPQEMANMFAHPNMPHNMVFEEEFSKLIPIYKPQNTPVYEFNSYR